MSREPGRLLTEMESELYAFLEWLTANGVSTDREALEDVILELARQNYMREDNSLIDTKGDIRLERARLIGLSHITQLLRSREGKSSFDQIRPFLCLFSKASHPSSVTANAPGPVGDTVGHHVFELLIACHALGMSEQVEVDHPFKQKKGRRNPDVVLRWRGRRWGLACKTIDSPQPRSYVTQVAKGARQIEECPDVDIGVVVVNLKNWMPVDLLWPMKRDPQGNTIYDGCRDGLAARDKLLEFCRFVRGRILAEGDETILRQEWAGLSKPIPIILQYAYGVALINPGDSPRNQPLSFLHAFPVRPLTPAQAEDVDDFVRVLTASGAWHADDIVLRP
jgi:hypothetical protein